MITLMRYASLLYLLSDISFLGGLGPVSPDCRVKLAFLMLATHVRMTVQPNLQPGLSRISYHIKLTPNLTIVT